MLNRRRKYFLTCQKIIDDIHYRLVTKGFVSEEECISAYGKSNYYALLHELHMVDATTGIRYMTPATEWMYHSQYFIKKANDERRQERMFWFSVGSACVAIASAVYTFYSNS